jgi:hypothetical protein
MDKLLYTVQPWRSVEWHCKQYGDDCEMALTNKYDKEAGYYDVTLVIMVCVYNTVTNYIR